MATSLVPKCSKSWVKIQTVVGWQKNEERRWAYSSLFAPEPTCQCSLDIFQTFQVSTFLFSTIFTWAPHNIKLSPNVHSETLQNNLSEVPSVLARTLSRVLHPSPSPLPLKPVHRDVAYGFSWKSSPKSASCQFRPIPQIFLTFNKNNKR